MKIKVFLNKAKGTLNHERERITPIQLISMLILRMSNHGTKGHYILTGLGKNRYGKTGKKMR